MSDAMWVILLVNVVAALIVGEILYRIFFDKE